VHKLFVAFKKAYDSVRREVLYNILIAFCVPMKIARLIKMCLTETCSRVRVGNNFSDMFLTRNGLKQGDAISTLLFIFALVHVIRRVQVNQDALKLNGTHQLLVYADDVNILGRRLRTVKKNTKPLVVASMQNGPEANGEKIKYLIIFSDLNGGKRHDINLGNASFGRT